jgi:zinc/manganese transport system ATP-binding protein
VLPAPAVDPERQGAVLHAGGPAVATEGLAAVYGDRTVWSGATFSLPSGSFSAIIGPNGAGKSTLVRMLLGLVEPAAGRIELLGHRPRRGNPAIGYVPQDVSFDPELSVRGRDYVGLGLDGHRWGIALPGSARRRRAEVDAVLRSVGAEGYADRGMGRLSGGEQQRLVLAQALVSGPRVLLLDEPLSNLDVRNQAATVRLVAEVAGAQGLTVILVAHDVNPLLPHIDRVVYVARGRIAVGPPSEIITSEALSRIYDAPIEVIRDRRGRLFVVGLEEEVGHPHAG